MGSSVVVLTYSVGSSVRKEGIQLNLKKNSINYKISLKYSN